MVAFWGHQLSKLTVRSPSSSSTSVVLALECLGTRNSDVSLECFPFHWDINEVAHIPMTSP